MESNYSLADIAAATGEDREDNWMWIIILFLFLFGFGGNGINRTNDATTQEILFGQQFQGLDQKIDRIGNGICDSTFALNNSITSEGRALQNQLASCCCDTNRNIDAVRHENAQNTCAITTAIHAEGEQTRALITANEVQALRDKVQELSLAQSQCAQNAYLTQALRPFPVPAYQVSNPYCGCGAECNNYGFYGGVTTA
jgi:hypothetical protein